MLSVAKVFGVMTMAILVYSDNAEPATEAPIAGTGTTYSDNVHPATEAPGEATGNTYSDNVH